ncbi:jun-like transcription factor domain-containing protein [Ditylenchus destructor]|uniref:Jun-like transcription factor domain-containing protein n=1 Tax=Ditylenchus destructor TaxID=166010 RepID=A0AAD4ND93_9BILA|nr:jun-like transcription factor domain-containing protein [Ditylenchus destructor]
MVALELAVMAPEAFASTLLLTDFLRSDPACRSVSPASITASTSTESNSSGVAVLESPNSASFPEHPSLSQTINNLVSYSTIYSRLHLLGQAALQSAIALSPTTQLPLNLASPTGYSSSGAIAAMNGLDSNPDAINGANISTINDGDQSSRLGQQPSVSSSSAYFNGATKRNNGLITNMAAADSTVSPLSLPRDLIDSILAVTPDKYFGLSQSLFAAANQHTIAETPTPTKFLYPKNVTKAQEVFVEGFQKALQKLQGEKNRASSGNNAFQQPTPQTCSPQTVKYLLSLLTPTLSLTPQHPQPPSTQSQTQSSGLSTLGTVAGLLLSNSATQGNTEFSSVTSTTTSTFSVPTTHGAGNKEGSNTSLNVGTKRKSTVGPLAKQIDVPSIVVSTSASAAATSQVSPASRSISSQVATVSGAPAAKKEKRTKVSAASPPIAVPTTAPSVEKTASDLLDQLTKLDPNGQGVFSSYMEFLQQPQMSGSGFGMSNFGMSNNSSTASHSMQYSHSPPQQAGNNGYTRQHHSPQQHQMVPQQHSSMPQIKQEVMTSFQQHLSTSPQMQNCGMASTSALQMFGGATNNHVVNSVDPDDQDRRKLERKRARNRMAASKCRQRKMERIHELEIQVQTERQRNAAFQTDIEHLKRTIFELNSQLTVHKQAGCNVNTSQTQFKVNNNSI